MSDIDKDLLSIVCAVASSDVGFHLKKAEQETIAFMILEKSMAIYKEYKKRLEKEDL